MSLDKLVAELNKTYGKQVVSMGSDLPSVDRVQCGIAVIDYIMGGGFAVNRITELYGPFSSGKSYVSYEAIAKFQKFDWKNRIQNGIKEIKYVAKKISSTSKEDGKVTQTILEIDKVIGVKPDAVAKRVMLVDYENTYDKEWGEKRGIDNEGLIHLTPDKGSELVDLVEAFLSEPEVGLIVVDSVAAVSSDLEIDASMEDEQMGVNARFWNKAMRKWQSAMNSNPEKDITVIIINRAYTKIGFVLGNPEQVGGGSGLSFGKSVSVRLNPLKVISGKNEDGTEMDIGRSVRCKCVKNKTARPFLEAEFYMSFIDDADAGLKAGEIDKFSQLVQLGCMSGIVKRGGAYYTYKREKVNGRDAFIEHIKSKGLYNKLYQEIMSTVTPGTDTEEE